MRRKRPHVASLDEVRITRQGDDAIIEYADERIWTTHFRLGSSARHMTDQEILDRWNECVLAQQQAAAEYQHIAVEIPHATPSTRRREPRGRLASRSSLASMAVSRTG